LEYGRAFGWPCAVARHRSRLESREDRVGACGHVLVGPEVECEAHRVAVALPEERFVRLPTAKCVVPVVSWFTSFGYFDDDANRNVLREAHRVLRPSGRLLIENNNLVELLPRWLPAVVSECDGNAQWTKPPDDLHHVPLAARLALDADLEYRSALGTPASGSAQAPRSHDANPVRAACSAGPVADARRPARPEPRGARESVEPDGRLRSDRRSNVAAEEVDLIGGDAVEVDSGSGVKSWQS